MSEVLSADGLLAAARDFDSGVDIDSRETAEAPTETTAPEPTESRTETPAKAEVTEDAADTDAQPAEAPQKETKQGEQKKESKFAQEQARKTKTWETINAEKQAIKAEKEALARERDEWQKQRQQTEAKANDTYRDEAGFTADDYEKAAKEFEADGDKDLAKAASKKAAEARKAAGEHQTKVQQERFNKAWEDTYVRLSEKEPDLKDPNSDLYKSTVDLIGKFQILRAAPDGLAHAVEIVKLQQSAARSQSLDAENKSLKEQLDKLQKKTAIGKGTATQPLKAEETDFAKMPIKEQRERLMKAAREFDRES
jgi:hypothetical protein